MEEGRPDILIVDDDASHRTMLTAVLEETGYQAECWQALGDYAVDGNRGAGRAHLYLATGAHQVAEPDGPGYEEDDIPF